MVTVTCKSVVVYENPDLSFIEPFHSARLSLAEKMFNEGKTDVLNNYIYVDGVPLVGQRTWVDHAAAQEWIDFVLLNAPTHNINVASAEIIDL